MDRMLARVRDRQPGIRSSANSIRAARQYMPRTIALPFPPHKEAEWIFEFGFWIFDLHLWDGVQPSLRDWIDFDDRSQC